MNHSFERIGAWSATFATETAVEGQVVKMSGNGEVAACAAGEDFCGVADPVRNGHCGVQLGGIAQVSYTGDAPAVGEVMLAADGKGGVCAAESGKTYLVVAVNAVEGTCMIKL